MHELPVSRWVTAWISAAALLILIMLGPAERAESGEASGETASDQPSSEQPSEAAGERPAELTIELAANRSGNDWFDRGKERYNSQNYASAAAAYLRAAEAGYRTETAYYNAACSFALDDQPDRALDALEAALNAGFDEPELVASDDDLNSLRANPRFERLLARAMATDHAVARKNGAVSEYETLRSRHSTDASAWRDVGVTLMRSGETTRALDAFATQFTIDSSASSIYNMACAMALGGKRASALATLERAIELGSGNAQHMAKDEDLRALRGDPEFTRLLDLAKDLDLNFPPMGGRGQWKRSIPRYERVTREHPEVGRAWFNLAYAQLGAGDARGCVDSNRRALALGYRVPTTMYNIACGYAQMDRPDDAIRWLERAEAAGLEVGRMAMSDDDLDPLHSDPRYRRMSERWRRQMAIDKLEKANKDKDED